MTIKGCRKGHETGAKKPKFQENWGRGRKNGQRGSTLGTKKTFREYAKQRGPRHKILSHGKGQARKQKLRTTVPRITFSLPPPPPKNPTESLECQFHQGPAPKQKESNFVTERSPFLSFIPSDDGSPRGAVWDPIIQSVFFKSIPFSRIVNKQGKFRFRSEKGCASGF